MQLWCAVPMSKKFIVQLSAVVIRQAGPAQNMFMSQTWRLSKGVGHFRQYFRGRGHRPLTTVGVRNLE